MVASRCPQRLNLRAAAINRSTSAAVRYSRVLTEELTMVGTSRFHLPRSMPEPVNSYIAESCRPGHHDEISWLGTRHSRNGTYIWNIGGAHSALMFAARITLPHFSTS